LNPKTDIELPVLWFRIKWRVSKLGEFRVITALRKISERRS